MFVHDIQIVRLAEERSKLHLPLPWNESNIFVSVQLLPKTCRHFMHQDLLVSYETIEQVRVISPEKSTSDL